MENVSIFMYMKITTKFRCTFAVLYIMQNVYLYFDEILIFTFIYFQVFGINA